MAKRNVKGLHKVISKGRAYWYAWRGGPRLYGVYGTPDFWASYDAAIRERRIPEPGRFCSLVTLYKASDDYRTLAPKTKRNWGPWFDKITDHFGGLSIAAFDNPRVRVSIRQWRSKYADTPRTADMGVQVLSRVCSYAVEQGKLTVNPCDGIKALYASDRSGKIWTAPDITRIKPYCSREVANVIDLAAATGLRRSDLLRLPWSHIQDHAIVTTTGKSKHRREVIIPLYDELREVLARVPKHSPIVLTNTKGRPWTDEGFGSSFNDAKIAAGISELHFHDLRGTAATRFYVAELPKRVIAEILGWSEENVDHIIGKYVDRAAATKAIIRQLNKRLESEQTPVKPTVKPSTRT
jgi:integrase